MLKVKKSTLIIITGVIWIIVGLGLLARIPEWIPLLSATELFLAFLLGVILAVLKGWFVFRKAVDRNIHRITNKKDELQYVFSFHTYMFYILLIPMIGAGVFLRTSEFIPRFFVLPIYTGIGLAMIYSGIRYLKYPKANL